MSAIPFTLAIDVGSACDSKGNDNLGWASANASGTGRNLMEAVQQLDKTLQADGRATIGFEAPIWTPRRSDLLLLTKSRQGEGSKPWNVGGGAGALTTGLALIPWVFAYLAPSSVTVSLDRWRERGGLFVWEAFVTGKRPHTEAARLALEAFASRWPDLQSDIQHERSLNLAVAAALAADVPVEPDEIRMPAIVIRSGRADDIR